MLCDLLGWVRAPHRIQRPVMTNAATECETTAEVPPRRPLCLISCMAYSTLTWRSSHR